jgi:hypothetical protein
MSALEQSLEEDVVEVSPSVEDAVNFDRLSDDSIEDSPRRFLQLAPSAIADGTELPGSPPALGRSVERFDPGDDATDDGVGPEGRLLCQIGS